MTAEGKDFKARVAQFATLAMKRYKPTPNVCEILINFHYGTSRSDIDGPVKLVMDALQGIVIVNDSQVRHLRVWKRVVDKGEQPYTHIEVNTLEE